MVASGFYRIMRRVTSKRTVVLAYHNVVPQGMRAVGDRGLHIPLDIFAVQLRELARTHEIVPVDELWTSVTDGKRPRAAVTFDDAYFGAVTLGVDVLVELGLPATIFVSPGLLGRHAFWWDLLGERQPDQLQQVRTRVLWELEGDGRLAQERYGLEESTIPLPKYAQTAKLPELLEAARRPGISLGAHGWSHRNLDVLPEEEARVEMRRSLDWLEKTVPESMIPWITYPYGSASQGVQRIARQTGFDGGFLCGGGGFDPLLAESGRFQLPRVNIPSSLSIDGFRLRATGVKFA